MRIIRQIRVFCVSRAYLCAQNAYVCVYIEFLTINFGGRAVILNLTIGDYGKRQSEETGSRKENNRYHNYYNN